MDRKSTAHDLLFARISSGLQEFANAFSRAWFRDACTLSILLFPLLGAVSPSAIAQSSADPLQRDVVPTERSPSQEFHDRDHEAESSIKKYLPLLAEFNRSAALMEQYKYSEASIGFEKVVAEQPDWIAAQFNLGLAYLNMQGVQGAEAHLDKAERMLLRTLQEKPDFAAAHYCLGMLYHHQGDIEKALKHFEAVYRLDPGDPYVGYQYARVLAAVGRYEECLETFEEVVASDPGFVSAVYGLAQQYLRSGQREKAMPLFERFKELHASELTGGSHTVRNVYGSAGKYYRVLGPDLLPIEEEPEAKQPSIVFSPEVRTLPFENPNRQEDAAFAPPGMAAADFDGDGDLDLLLTTADANRNQRLLLNDGAGRFTPGSTLPGAIISPATGDVDNDGDSDLWLGRVGKNMLMMNDGDANFETASPSEVVPEILNRCARLVDIDSDGDLDLLSFGVAMESDPGRTHQGEVSEQPRNIVLNNNRDGTFEPIAERLGLDLEGTPIATIVHDDFDNDRDLDAVLFPADDQPPCVWVNDRIWQYHMLTPEESGLEVTGVIGATAGDPNKDGRQDLLLFFGDRVELWLNRPELHFEPDETFCNRLGRLGGSSGQFVDMDNDGDLDILIPDALRRDGTRGPTVLVNDSARNLFTDQIQADTSNLLSALETEGPAVGMAADFTGNGRCDLLLADNTEPPRLIENITRGGNWIAMDLAGTRRQDNKSRSNRSAIGARVEVKTGNMCQQYTVGVPIGPTAVAPLRIHAGLGDHQSVEWLRIFWPDAVLQAELELPAGQLSRVEEIPRKTSSCPFLFAWDGEHYQMVSDFCGVGGLGYFLAPGCYAKPDSTEYLPIPTLKDQDGEYVLQVIEPLEEVIYFDEAKLLAVDHPVGTRVYPNEMMAIGCDPPEFELFCFRDTIEPVRAIDLRGQDVTEFISQIDRRYAGATEVDHRFLGFAQPHSVELDFGDRLSHWNADERLIFCAYGWVEYGYSGTNFAAYQAGMEARAPSFEVLRNGEWVEVLPNVGYPAGVEHIMTLELTDVLQPTDRKLRITSNMELYWDRIFLAVHQRERLGLHEIAADSADLHFLGYPREYSPDGKLPTLYDYSNIDPSLPWKLMSGDYTRFGEVAELLEKVDDCFVIMGRGEEVTLRFSKNKLPSVPEGFQRSFLLKADAYCKDMDLYTAYPDTVEPLPFHGMSGYPYGEGEQYPDTEVTRRYRSTYNTRRIHDR